MIPIVSGPLRVMLDLGHQQYGAVVKNGKGFEDIREYEHT